MMSDLQTIYLHKHQVLTMQKQDVAHFSMVNFRSIEWFRPGTFDMSTTTSYGNYVGSFNTRSTLNLLNLSNQGIRKLIQQVTMLTEFDMEIDTQMCHSGNLKIHNAILNSSFFDMYHGTVMSSQFLENGDPYDLDGPEEIVLFKARTFDRIILDNIKTLP